ncbi:MAG: ABC transporter ATP-binding protein [Lachnospiraceae bacterium]|nr:ABC transporter ATP-binding protein [Lachnospiraceae bacterium]
MESIRYIRDVVHLLQPKEKRTLMGILFVNLGQAFWEMCSISMLLPYLYIVLDCDSAKQHSILARVYDWPFLRSDIRFILFLSLLILVLYAMRSGYLIFSVWFVNRKTVRFRKNFAVRLYRYYLTRPYPFYFQSNHTQLQRNINQISSTVVDKILLAGVNLIRMAVTGICILVMLVWIDKVFTGIIVLVMGSICFFLYQKVKRMARETSAEGNRVWKQVHRTVLEYLKGIKEVRLMQLQPSIVHQYEQARTRLEQTIVRLDLLNAIPSQILEMCVIVSVLMIVILNAVRGRTAQESIAVIGVFAMAAVRIKPIIMGVYSQFLSLQSSLTYFQDVEADLQQAFALKKQMRTGADRKSLLEKEKAVSRAPGEIAFEQVSYTYPGTDKRVLSDVSVTIHQGALVGIGGPSGGGKSTFLDLLLGLLIPEEGRITADGVSITGREADWYPLIGYVPQEIYLLDDTIERNIVFDPEEQPDEKQLKQALEQAELLSYVHTLPEGLQARVGDGGIALSGGQKQRLGIARMLYRNPEIMVFDEATSALDLETEAELLRTILQWKGKKTIFMVAHRPSVFQECDVVYEIRDGKIGIVKK